MNCTVVEVESYNTIDVLEYADCDYCHSTKKVHKTYEGNDQLVMIKGTEI